MSKSSQKRKQQEEYSIDPIDFNPSLYPKRSRNNSSNNSSVNINNSSNENNTYYYQQQSQQSQQQSQQYQQRSYIKDSNYKMPKKSWTRSTNTLNTKAIEKMFDDIADEDDPSISSMEGICKIAEKLNIDPMEDIRILVLLQKLGANEKPAQISREEWINGCSQLQCDSIEKFANLLPSLDTGFMVDGEFREFYKFCFQFNRQGTHKTLDKDLVVALVEMTLKGRIPQERLSSFIDFLNQTEDKSYNRITLDQWMSFHDFCKECTDLNDYDEEVSAWPVLIDDYVDFATSMQT